MNNPNKNDKADANWGKKIPSVAAGKKKELAKKIQATNPAGLDKRYKPKYH